MKKPIINCHTHIFTGDHVPPWLAKTFLPWPFYFLLRVSLIVKLFRIYYKGSYRGQFQGDHKKRKKIIYTIKAFVTRNIMLKVIIFIIGWWLTLHAFFILFGWLASLTAPDSKTAAIVADASRWLESKNLLFIPDSLWLKLVMIFIVIGFVKSGRNFILFIFKKIWSFF